MNKQKAWFEVDAKGLRSLLGGKDKSFIIKELVQNAFDEPIKNCNVSIEHTQYQKKPGLIKVIVEDDSPIGFRDLSHAYTLFGDTYKRRDISKRGRFNLGEKLTFSICDSAILTTTKGTITFDKNGRREDLAVKTEKGSKIVIWLQGSVDESIQMVNTATIIIAPKSVEYRVNGIKQNYSKPHKVINTKLTTEIEKNGQMIRVVKNGTVHVRKSIEKKKYLYEIGIPVTEIECDYDIDLQQKVPLTMDRETVMPHFLQDVYAEVLNVIYDELDENSASSLWVRIATSDSRVSKEATKAVLQNRFGDKFLVANNFDPNSIDEAIAKGFTVLRGSQLSKEEWEVAKGHDLMQSTSDLFGYDFGKAERVKQLSEGMKQTEKLVKKIGKELMDTRVKVTFVNADGTTRAQFNSANNELMFNVTLCGEDFFNKPVSVRVLSLILHELGHKYGKHTDHNYHEALTALGSKLTIKALEQPDFFN